MALVLTRKDGESLAFSFPSDITEAELKTLLQDGITITIRRDARDHIRLMIEAPDFCSVSRGELLSNS
ncbi:carbon storage regulator [Aquipseudomonas guryensis]|uniref:Carbon storage regulator n=1 Tax=Aquipseudomonas guryensis TaxID=2759165 RepID=A0A7W4DBC7_9GAMM|nr:carbon storage regulator [Pseudomonas guryensis]MBB1519467.1 carbon storage regulator [Pseudomonas guryensis]